MRFKAAAVVLAAAVVAALAFTPALAADEWNKKTKITFDQPVEIPGVGAQILPAGTYVFKLLDSSSNRHIVQVFSQDETHVFATILAIPNYRLKATDKTVMTFRERAAGQPEALRAWFYPGNTWGQEFVYPKSRAIELAKVTHQPVLAMPSELAENIVAPVKTADEPPVVALKTATVVAVTPAGEEVAAVAVVQAPPATAATRDAAPREEALPQTAGSVPLFALMGLLSLCAGLGLSAIPKRSA